MMSIGVQAQKPLRLKPVNQFHLSIPEPSDLCLTPDGAHFYIVSDNGLLFETDLNGTVTRQSTFSAYDLEGCYADADNVYIVDERTRKVHLLDHKNLQKHHTYEVPYMASRNRGYESLCFNPAKSSFLLISEKDPSTIFECDASWRVQNETDFKGLSDISAATYYDGKLYLLSDEAHQLWEVDATTYSPTRKFELGIINPEGVAFDKSGNLYVISDDRAILYHFGPLPSPTNP
jgi:uncharacterized protein YjiK